MTIIARVFMANNAGGEGIQWQTVCRTKITRESRVGVKNENATGNEIVNFPAGVVNARYCWQLRNQNVTVGKKCSTFNNDRSSHYNKWDDYALTKLSPGSSKISVHTALSRHALSVICSSRLRGTLLLGSAGVSFSVWILKKCVKRWSKVPTNLAYYNARPHCGCGNGSTPQTDKRRGVILTGGKT